MNEDELAQALAHDLELKRLAVEQPSSKSVAMRCLRDAALAARAAECALAICKVDGVSVAQGAAHMALDHLEQALVVLGSMTETDE